MRAIPLFLKIRKAPVVDTSAPLKGIKIAIDAGHGGDDAGAIGPTALRKKRLTLILLKNCKKHLKTTAHKLL